MFPYEWKLSDGYPAKGIENHGLKVFGTFICGGGSSMGYKLAGFDHLGGVEIDPEMAKVYKQNHAPKHLYLEDIRKFRKRDDIPRELFNLDMLDGSPPCSSFSMAGSREEGWGKKKKFREGQSCQVLDDLFFEYIALAKRLQPRVVVAENVKGMLMGNARSYIKRIKRGFEEAGYTVQLFLLNAASMGVPQRRERVFFVCQRRDMNFKKLKLEFNCKPIVYREIKSKERRTASVKDIQMKSKKSGFVVSVSDDLVHNTILGSTRYLDKDDNLTTEQELIKIGAFPSDYNFLGTRKQYLIGMSVPPVMTAQISNQIYQQWFKR